MIIRTFTDPIAVTWLSVTKAILTTYMMGICIMCMTITSMNIRLKCHRPIPTVAHRGIVAARTTRAMCTDLDAGMSLCPMGITWTTWSTGIFITLTATIATIMVR